jgi:hypothetical protein
MDSRIIPQDFYVYLHRRATDNSVFYVGKGVKRRAWSKKNRNIYWHRTVEKYGYTVEIVMAGLQSWYALELERDIVARYSDSRLANLTSGGDGIWLASEETRKKISASKRGKNLKNEHAQKIADSLRGRKHSEETKRRIAEGQRGNKRGPETGKKISEANKKRPPVSDETRKKLSAAAKGRKPSEKAVELLRQRWADRKPITEETRAKLSAASKGRKQSPEAIAKTVAFHTGRKRPEEFRERMREIAKNRPKPSEEHKKKISEGNLRRWAKIKENQAQLPLDFMD